MDTIYVNGSVPMTVRPLEVVACYYLMYDTARNLCYRSGREPASVVMVSIPVAKGKVVYGGALPEPVLPGDKNPLIVLRNLVLTRDAYASDANGPVPGTQAASVHVVTAANERYTGLWIYKGAVDWGTDPVSTCSVSASSIALVTKPGETSRGSAPVSITCDGPRRVRVLTTGKGGGDLDLGSSGLHGRVTVNGEDSTDHPIYVDVPGGGTTSATVEVTVDAAASVEAGKYKGVVKVIIDEP